MTRVSQNEFRSYFKVVEDRIYLNHAAYSPMSEAVAKAIRDYTVMRSSGSPETWSFIVADMEQLRQNYARLVNATPERIAIMPNTVTGVNVLSTGLHWQAGDRILLYEHEFPANVYPFTSLKSMGVEVDFISHVDGRLPLDVFEQALTSRTRLVSVSTVQYLTGFRVDLKALVKLCHDRNILVSADAIQSVGALSTDVIDSGVDFLAAGGHKWQMAPLGSGFCYVSAGLQEQLDPVFTGYIGKAVPEDFDNFEQPWSSDARRFELGAPAAPCLAGARAATDLLLAAGMKSIEKHILELGDYLIAGLEKTRCSASYDFPAEAQSGIRMVTHADPSRNKDLFDYLTRQGVNLSLRDGHLRFSPHYYNTRTEVDRLLEYIRDFD